MSDLMFLIGLITGVILAGGCLYVGYEKGWTARDSIGIAGGEVPASSEPPKKSRGRHFYDGIEDLPPEEDEDQD